MKKSTDKVVKKCYSCRKSIRRDTMFCKKCEKDPNARKHTMGTLIIYNTV